MCWRNKLFFTLVVYFTGFATAIYVLVPVNAQAAEVREKTLGTVYSERKFNSQAFAQKTSNGLHKFISFAEDKASEVKRRVKAKLTEGQGDSED
jgi:hypothetical protein